MSETQKLIGQDVAAAWDETSQRITGKTVAEWEGIWRHRRVMDLRKRVLRGDHLYTVTERNRAMVWYDFDEGDFQPTVESDGTPSTLANEVAKTPFEAAANPGLVRVVRYQLTAACLRRIENEASQPEPRLL